MKVMTLIKKKKVKIDGTTEKDTSWEEGIN